MYKLQEVKLKPKKKLRVSLQLVKGIGSIRANYICSALGLGQSFSIHKLNKHNFQSLNLIVKELYVLGDRLKVEKSWNIKNLKQNKTYRGLRHTLKLPLRGQRTHTNARTNKKKRS